ncbi:MAG: hypothetical protein R3A48_04100 [Polyangiales bacterium]
MGEDPDETHEIDENELLSEPAEPSQEPLEELSDGRARKPRLVDPAIVALFPPGAAVDHEVIAAAQRAWREATQREAPSIERLAERGTVRAVDADLSSGYLAVTTADDTWRAFVPQDQLALVIALMLRRPLSAVAQSLAEGPGTLAPPAEP